MYNSSTLTRFNDVNSLRQKIPNSNLQQKKISLHFLVIGWLVFVPFFAFSQITNSQLKTDTTIKRTTPDSTNKEDSNSMAFSERIKLVASLATSIAAIIGLLTFTVNIRTKNIDNKRAKAKLIKDQLGELNLYTYLFTWTTIPKSHISIYVENLIIKLKEICPDFNNRENLIKIMKDPFKIKIITSVAWHNTRAVKEVENYFTLISKVQIFFNYYFPFLYLPINDFAGQLRIMYLSDTFLEYFFRDEKFIKELDSEIADGIQPADALQRIFFRHLNSSRNKGSRSMTFIEEFYQFCNQLDHNDILKLSLVARKTNRSEIPAIRKFEQIGNYISKDFKGAHSEKIAEQFATYVKEELNSDEERFYRFLKRINEINPDDYDVQVFLAVIDGGLENLKEAISKGGNARITQGELTEKYSTIWESRELDNV